MFVTVAKSENKKANYEKLLESFSYLVVQEDNWITTLSNTSALLNYFLDDINWVGFYLYDGEKLYLGPFQGLPACTMIKLGSGVCGGAAQDQKTYLVEDVHAFPGHIACDAASNSEIVVPIVKEGRLIGVLDIDSPTLSRFDETDKEYLEKLVAKLVDIKD